ncbi:MAG: ABC transporter ATP-binding protein [Rickettsiales bacterium]|jgi:ABC-2 type transport system ATP-binding protein|nr:ABC transporter ATP-binding protein [Rickettsiales bacterium]
MFSIDISGLSKTYKNGHQALKEINLKVRKGQFLALLGKNGAGKTTLVEILSSLTKKSTGTVIINGKDLDNNAEFAKLKVGIVPQEVNLSFFEKVMQVLITQAGYFGIDRDVAIKRAEKHLKNLDLWEKRNHAVMTLSGGMKRRLMVARALMHEPEIIFFDEPTAGVDAEVRQKIWKIMQDLNNEGKTIILTTHYFDEAERLCDSLAIISKGVIIMNDSLRKILNQYPKQKYLVEIKNDINLALNDNAISQISDCLFEISVNLENSLSSSIKNIINYGGEIISIKPKNNRLEELFLNIAE